VSPGVKALWGTFFFACTCVALAYLFSCVGAQVVAATADTAECEKDMAAKLVEASSCNEAQFKIDAVIATNPACRGFAHFEVCALVKDGGSDADH